MNIKADPTLVSAAGALASAQKPFDMSVMADDLLESYTTMMDDISTNFKAGIEELDTINADVEEAMETLQKKINDGTIDNREERAYMQDILDGYRAELKGVGLFGKENKKKRDNILYEVNKYIKDQQAQGDAMSDIVTTFEAGDYDRHATKAPALAFIGQLAKHFNGDETENLLVRKIDHKNHFSFIHTDVNGEETIYEDYSVEEIKKLLIKDDQDLFIEINKKLNDTKDYVTKNEAATADMVFGDLQNGLFELLQERSDGFRSIISKKILGQPMSFLEALNTPGSTPSKEIFTVLMSLAPKLDQFGPDGKGNPDGVITPWTSDTSPGDFGTKENYQAFVKRLTEPEPGDEKFAHEAYARWVTQTEGNSAIQMGIDLRPEKEEEQVVYNPYQQGNWGATHFKSYEYKVPVKGGGDSKVKKTVYNRDLPWHANKFNEIEAAGKGSWQAYDGNSYFLENGIWTMVNPYEEETKVTRGDVINNLGWGAMMQMLGIPPTAPKQAQLPTTEWELQNFNPADWTRTEDGNWVRDDGSKIYATKGKYKASAGGWRGFFGGTKSTQAEWRGRFVGGRDLEPRQGYHMAKLLEFYEKGIEEGEWEEYNAYAAKIGIVNNEFNTTE